MLSSEDIEVSSTIFEISSSKKKDEIDEKILKKIVRMNKNKVV